MKKFVKIQDVLAKVEFIDGVAFNDSSREIEILIDETVNPFVYSDLDLYLNDKRNIVKVLCEENYEDSKNN